MRVEVEHQYQSQANIGA